MPQITSLVPPEPEPEKPKTIEEQVVEYRINYRAALKRAATAFALHLTRKAIAQKAATVFTLHLKKQSAKAA